MKRFHLRRGFSLIEVTIAAGIFAGTIAVVVALTTALFRQSAETIDTLTAARLPDAVKVELDRLAAAGWDALAGRVPELTTPLPAGLALAAARESGSAQSLDYLPAATGQISNENQYYLVECWRFPQEPLRYDPTKAFLALHVRVSWPYRLPGLSAPVPLTDRSQLTFVVSLNR